MKLTLADLEAEISGEFYFTAGEGIAGAVAAMSGSSEATVLVDQDVSVLDRLTFCVLVLHNGAKFVGINYGSVDPAENKPELGRRYAREDAISKLWEPLGFRLRDKLAGTPRPDFGINQAVVQQNEHERNIERTLLVEELGAKLSPSIGRLVHYVLGEEDAAKINGRRTDGAAIQDRILEDKWPIGAQAHIGNKVFAGDVLPAMVVRVLPNEQASLQVYLDGNDVYWATTKARALAGRTEPGRWHWPARV